MAERTLRLTVTAAADRSLTAVVQPLVDSVSRAKVRVTGDTKAMGDSMARSFEQAVAKATAAQKQMADASARVAAKEAADAARAAQAKVREEQKSFDQRLRLAQKAADQTAALAKRAADKEAADAARAAQQKAAAEARAFDQRLRAAQRAADQRARLAKRESDAEEREILRTVAAHERAEERKVAAAQRAATRAAKRAQDKDDAFYAKIGQDALRGTGQNMLALGRGAMGLAGQIASGAGVSFDIGSSIGRGVGLESRIVDIINQAKLGGQDPGTDARGRLTKLSRDVADENGLSANAAANVLGSFQGFSSDLAGGEAVLGRLGKLAKATGTDFSDMGDAAGRVNAQLMSMPEYQNDAVKRGDALMSIMRHITKQTADGSVEMSDFSRYIGRIAASANFFAGSFEENIGQLGAMAQMAMKGGASTASEATGSAAAFARDVRKHKTQAKWEAQGINIFADKDNTKLKSPQQLILEYLAKEGASQKNLAELFPNVVSQRAVQNSIDIFSAAGGGQKGLAAVKAEFAKFGATIGEGDVNKLAGEKMNTTESKAQVFQNQLDRIAASMAEKVLPQMEAMAPKLLQVVDALSKVVSWAASAPLGEVVGAALVASIAKAGIGSAVNASINKLIEAAAGSKFGGLTVSAATIGVAVGTLIAHKLNTENKEGKEAVKEQVKGNAETIKKAEQELKDTGTLSAPTLASLKGIKSEGADLLKEASAPKISDFDVLNPFSNATGRDQGRQKEINAQDMEISHQSGDIDRLIAAVEKSGKPEGVQEVRVTNMPTGSLVGGDGVEGIPPP